MTDIKLTEYENWLISRKYKQATVTKYCRPLRIAVQKSLNFADIEGVDVEDLYFLLYGRNAPNRHTARAEHQGIYTYREFLERGVSV